MLILYLTQFIIDIFEKIIVWVSTNNLFIHDTLESFQVTLLGLHIPQTFTSIIGLSFYFLPMGTVTTLLFLTIALIIIQIVHAFIRWLVHLAGLV